MIRGHQHEIILKGRDLPVPEVGSGGREWNATGLQGIQAGPKGDLAQGHDHPDLPEQREFLQEEGETALDLDWGWLVVWWGASDSGSDIAIREVKVIVAIGRDRLIGEAGSVERPIEEVAASIPGEDPTGPVPTVSSRRQADHEQARGRITESGDRSPPVFPLAVPPHLLLRRPLPMSHQSRATSAGDDLLAERLQPARLASEITLKCFSSYARADGVVTSPRK